MELTLTITGIVALVCFAIVCLYAMSTLNRVRDLMLDVQAAVDETKRVASELNKNLPQAFNSLQTMSDQITSTMKNADDQLDSLSGGIADFKAVSSRINNLEARLQQKIEGPLMQAATVVSGVSKAINAFVNGVSKR